MLNIILGAAIAVAIIAALIAVVRFSRLSVLSLGLMGLGAFIGLTLGALLSVPISNLPAPYGTSLPLIVTIMLTTVSIVLTVNARRSVSRAWSQWRSGTQALPVSGMPGIVVDTSVIIDGRIADIAKAGFVPGRLLVPRFVLAELQNIADSSDAMRRGRGRRGLEVLNSLQSHNDVEVEVVDQEIPEIKEVDAKLVRLAKNINAHILTTDFNLNRVAQIEGVRVLNVNELSNAVRPVVLPGEKMVVKVVQPGKEKGQGVGYLPDGTMIVVDKGDKLIGQEVATEITRVFQTVAGKMLFAAPVGTANSSESNTATAAPMLSSAHGDAKAPERSHQRGRGNGNGRGRNRPERAQNQSQNVVDARPKLAGRHANPAQKLENSLMEMTNKSVDRE